MFKFCERINEKKMDIFFGLFVDLFIHLFLWLYISIL